LSLLGSNRCKGTYATEGLKWGCVRGNVCRGFRTIESGRKEKNNYMAEVINKYPQNASGRFYVDDQCIDCDLCRETAPANFARNDDGGHSYVYKQPESPEEEAQCKEAMDGCPVEAIGDDSE
jgi:ferredoxin